MPTHLLLALLLLGSTSPTPKASPSRALWSPPSTRVSRPSFDAVILDLTIPEGTGGDEAILSLLEIDPDVRAVLSSGYADNNVMNDFREFGFKAAIAKPFNFKELAAVLARVLCDPR